MTIDIFWRRVKFAPLCIYKAWTVDFSETIEHKRIRLGIILEINKYMKIMSARGQGHCFWPLSKVTQISTLSQLFLWIY